MAYDQALAERIRLALEDTPGVVEKKMFGGVGYLVRGNMACGVNRKDLILRLGPERAAQVQAMPAARPFDMTGRPMKGWLLIAPEGLQDDETFRTLLQWSVEHAQSLTPK